MHVGLEGPCRCTLQIVDRVDGVPGQQLIPWQADLRHTLTYLELSDVIMSVIQDQPSVGESAAVNAATQTVVVVDDQSTGRLILAEVIRGIDRTINTVLFSNPVEAIDYIRTKPVDLVLTDYKMPQMDGIEVIRQLRSTFTYEQLPVVMTTIVSDREVRYNAFEAGATDFLIRPVDPIECRARCHNLLNLRQQYLINHNHARVLEERVAEVTRELRLREVDTLFRLARAMQNRDTANGLRLRRVARCAGLIARGIGMTVEEVDIIELAVGLHDVGSVCIPEIMLQKSAPMTAEESAMLKSYAYSPSEKPKAAAPHFMRVVAAIAVYQHEKFDGSGYPSGLRGEAIPIEARIVALANQVDVLASAHVGSGAADWSAIEIALNAQKNRDFDPALVDSLLRHQAAAEAICVASATVPPLV